MLAHKPEKLARAGRCSQGVAIPSGFDESEPIVHSLLGEQELLITLCRR